MGKNITAILVNKDRPHDQIMRCLNSIMPQNCNIIVVDYGSKETNSQWQKNLFQNVTVIKITRNTKVFNKCRALNIGIKAATTPYIMTGDIDIEYHRGLITALENEIQPDRLVTIRRFNMDRNNKLIRPSVRAYGGCITIYREWLLKVRGFDEYYTYWGREDDDLIDRAIEDGIKLKIIPAEITHCVHHYHEPAIKKTFQKNDKYYNLQGKPIIRNSQNWGIK